MTRLQSPLLRYVGIILFLTGYALLPLVALTPVYSVYRVLLVSLIINTLFPTSLGALQSYCTNYLVSMPLRIVNLSIEILCAFQENIDQAKKWLENDNNWFITASILSMVALIPTSYLYLTQLFAAYVMSLFSYQLASIYCDKQGVIWLRDPIPVIEPSKEQKVYLSELNIAQMKLVTMFLVNVVTFIPMSYMQGVALFMFVPLMVPPFALCIRRGVNLAYQQVLSRFPEGISLKNFEAMTILCMLFTLLINYKYENNLLNFLLAMYSSIIIGRIGSNFFRGYENINLTVSEEAIQVLYSPTIIRAFWAICLLYEATSLIVIPKILFIALAILIGVDINMPFDYVMSIVSRVHKPVSLSSQFIEQVSSYAVFSFPISTISQSWTSFSFENKTDSEATNGVVSVTSP
jgi:hypothetical protein